MTVRPPGRFSFVTLPGMIVVIRALAFRLAHSGSVHPIANVPPPAAAPKHVLTAAANASRVALGLNVGTTVVVGLAASVPQANPGPALRVNARTIARGLNAVNRRNLASIAAHASGPRCGA